MDGSKSRSQGRGLPSTASGGRCLAMERETVTERNRLKIITVATTQFAEKGFAGARVDEIAAATETSKRMIYYHFGSKDGLYRAVLTEAYRGIRAAELDAGLDAMTPVTALARLTALTFDYHVQHPELVRLVADENMLRGPHMDGVVAPEIETLPGRLSALIARGVAAGSFRAGLDPVGLHMTISALAFHFVANRYTFGALFGVDLGSADAATRRRAQIVDTVLHACLTPEGLAGVGDQGSAYATT